MALIDKTLEYQKHQRDYSMLGSTVVAKGLFSENKEFFGTAPNPIFLVIKDGIFYHFMSRLDAKKRCQSWLKNNGLGELQKADEKYGKELQEFNRFYGEEHSDWQSALDKAFGYLIDFTNIVFVGYEMPEYCGDEIPKDLNNFCFEIRGKYEDVHKRCLSAIEKIVGEIEKKEGLTKGTLLNLTLPEFKEYLESKKLPADLAGRNNFFLVKYTENGEESYTDPKLWSEFQEEEKVVSSELKGKTACGGFARGIVRIIHKVEEASKMQEGEILVASMTDPRYVPAIKKSAAIVTDEGGITCHAAIVSRELKIPCVIGTKHATSVLKDGMMVEVDADKGVVRIME